MSTSRNSGRLRAAAKHTTLLAGLAVALHALPAGAQDAGEEKDSLEEIVVVGYARSISDAVGLKQREVSVVEVLSIEDIGQLPEISLGDSLERLTGLSADKNNRGNASQISIRGLGPEMAFSTLNGTPLASSDPTRNIRFDIYPSELVGGAVVRKSPVASETEGAISGLINLKLVDPLSYDERRTPLSYRPVYNDLGRDFDLGSGDAGHRATAFYVDQFADNTIGVALGVADIKMRGTNLKSTVYGMSGVKYDSDGDGQGDAVVPFGVSQTLGLDDETRQGFVSVVQWRPTAELEVGGHLFYSTQEIHTTAGGWAFANKLNDVKNNSFENVTVLDDGVVAATVTDTNASASGARMMVQASSAHRDDKNLVAGANIAWENLDWRVKFDTSFSRVDGFRNFVNLATQQNDPDTGNGIAGVYVDFDAAGRNYPTFSTNHDLTSVAANSLYDLRGSDHNKIDDEIFSPGLDFTRKLNRDTGFTDIKFGVKYTGRDKTLALSNVRTNADKEVPFTNSAGKTWVGHALSVRPQIPEQCVVSTDGMSGYDGSLGLLPVLRFDADCALANVEGWDPLSALSPDKIASWAVEEDVSAGYLQGDFAGDWGSVPFSGNIGVRYVQTDLVSSGYRQLFSGETSPDGDGTMPIVVDKTYRDALPSFNMAFYLTDEHMLRFAAAKTIARPVPEALRAGFTVSNNQNRLNGGNPELDPYKADQVDVSWEWYFCDACLFSVAAFYKDVNTLIDVQSRFEDIEGEQWEVTQPQNVPGDSMSGFELQYTRNHELGWGNLGMQLNYAYTDSDLKGEPDPISGVRPPLIGYAKNVGAATIWTEIGKFSVRTNYTYRDGVRNYNGTGYDRPSGTTSAQLAYRLNKKVRFALQMNNLTNEVVKQYDRGIDTWGVGSAEHGRTFFFGVYLNP